MRLRSILFAVPLLVAGLVPLTIAGAAPVTWTQMGAPIVGAAPDSLAGWGVAASGDGSRIAIGSIEDGVGNGRVQVFDWTGSAWTQVGATLVGEAYGDKFGFSVDLSTDGTRLAVGAPDNAGSGGLLRGSVRVFELVGSTWTQLGGDIDGNADGGLFGLAVALSGSGSRVVVSAPQAAANAGKVQSYDWNGSTWVQHFSNIVGTDPGDLFGYSLALSADGNRLAVGAGEHDAYRGHVRVFDWNGSGWTQAGVDIDGVSPDDRAGRAVALSADGLVLAIGSPFRDGAGTVRGQVRVFRWDGSAWTPVGAAIDGNADNVIFGTAVALSADGLRVVAGAPYADAGGQARGQAIAFDWDGAAWVQAGAPVDGVTTNGWAGRSLALSGSGTRLVLGAAYDGEGSTAIGRVRMFEAPRYVAPVGPAYTG